jgi:hypothetical protein
MYIEQSMSKQHDFAMHRRYEGRALTRAVRELTALIQTEALQHGINFQAVLDEAAARKSEDGHLLAERLQKSVLPLFCNRSGRPERAGTCVLVRLQSDFFVFTAAHVLRDAGSSIFFAPSQGEVSKLLPLPRCTAQLKFSGGHNDLDVAVLLMPAHELGPFHQSSFLTGDEIDNDDRPDDNGLESFYLVFGYSASRTQVKTSRMKRHIHQQSFRCSTNPVGAQEYQQEELSQADHILLDFDHKEIRVDGSPATPPKLQGVSGGGVFQVSRRGMRGPLVAIAIQHRRSCRLIVGTRIKHFLAMARELKTMST